MDTSLVALILESLALSVALSLVLAGAGLIADRRRTRASPRSTDPPPAVVAPPPHQP